MINHMIPKRSLQIYKAEEYGSLSLEAALILGAAVIVAVSALPVFFHGMSGYLNGFSETEIVTTTE